MAWLVLGWFPQLLKGVCFPWEVWPEIFPRTLKGGFPAREGGSEFTPEKSMVGSDDSFPFLGQKTYFQSRTVSLGECKYVIF